MVHENVHVDAVRDDLDTVVMDAELLDAVLRKLKQLLRPVRGYKTMKTACVTIKGFEVMRALRKGQARAFALQGGIISEARIVERAFGVGPCALTEAIESNPIRK